MSSGHTARAHRIWQGARPYVAGLLLGVLILVGIVATRDREPSRSTDTANAEQLQLLVDRIEAMADAPPSRAQLTRAALRGMLSELDDRWAVLLDPKGVEGFRNLARGSYAGVGMRWARHEDALVVVAILPDSPAEDAGVISVGDRLRAIHGEPVELSEDPEAIPRELYGEAGSKLEMTLQRPDGTDYDVDMIRREVALRSVYLHRPHEKVGLIEILVFSAGTGEAVREAVRDFEAEGVDGLILDLRSSPGGIADEAAATADVFLNEGLIIEFTIDGEQNRFEAKRERDDTTLPLVVLVDAGTVSAAEAAALALQANGRAPLLGRPTYGKGSVQRLVPLSDGWAAKFTVSRYRGTGGAFVPDTGLTPDHPVENHDEHVARAVDLLLAG